jgi:ABC-type polar amino acid transport system ATPase subunit
MPSWEFLPMSGATLDTQSPEDQSRPDQYLLKAEGIRKAYGALEAVSGVDFAISRGEKVCILGPSGSGKTTLLRCMNLLVEPTEGRLYFKGDLIGSWPPVHTGWKSSIGIGRYRSRVAMVFQQFELFPHLTASQNVMLGPTKVLRVPVAAAREQAVALLTRVGLRDFVDAKPRTMSGGQQQRVAIARALAMTPDLILFDEPTSALDWEMVGEVLDIMAEVAADGMTMVIVTHELGFARRVADRVIVMEAGRIIEEGPTKMMFESPSLPRTRDILGIVQAELEAEREHPTPTR